MTVIVQIMTDTSTLTTSIYVDGKLCDTRQISQIVADKTEQNFAAMLDREESTNG